MGGLRSSAILLGSFLLVYLLTPYLVGLIFGGLPASAGNLERGSTILAVLAVYGLLRKWLGAEMPRI